MKSLKFNLKTKLILLFMGIGSIPILIAGFVAYRQAAKEITDFAESKATTILQGRGLVANTYFSALERVVADLAHLPTSKAAVQQFSDIFKRAKISENTERYQTAKAELTKYYSDEFGGEYKKQNGRDIDITGYFAKLDPVSVLAQHEFIVQNENPLGQKNKLYSSKTGSTYSRLHQDYHTLFNATLERHSLYDVFLIDKEGRVVYTVFKELDFATDLRNGPWASTGLASAFEGGLKTEPGKVHMQDFAAYTPSYDGPAGFMSAPITDADGKVLGVVAVQFPIDKLNAVVNDRSSLGKTGDMNFLGGDGRLRTDTLRVEGANHLRRTFSDSSFRLDSPLWNKALAEASNEPQVYRMTSYDGLPVIGVAQKMKLGGLEWTGIVELGEAEALQGLRTMQMSLLTLFVITLVLVSFAALWFGRRLSKELDSISGLLGSTSRQVYASSQQSASAATELSEAATEQAASLQETMASIEEISAMVSQNAEAAVRAKAAVDLNQVASDDGSKSVDAMLRSIDEIKSTNDEILTHMESSNKEFSDIVKIISDIGEKTTIINDIVFQTKLLSFNASVEAARAGEHGKGFAVVAEEVGNLAQMSGTASREITEMLNMSVKRVNTIVEQTRERVDRLVEVGQDKIAMGHSTAQRCRESLSKISENAKSLSSMVSEIAHASKEQSQGIQEINKAISQLDQVTQQNSAVAQHSSSQAEELNSHAEELQNAVGMLVRVVNGEGEAQHQDAHHSNGSNSHGSNVVKIKNGSNGHGASNGKAAAPKTTAQRSFKKVSGDSVPSANDPGFEEF
jgi:methyl-accepting chemotaxis protein